MMDFLTHVFGWVCGQNPSHTWAPGGLAMPCCQRCTGLYAGALAGLILHGWTWPRASRPFLALHGLFILQILPCGLYWVPQGPILRTLSGILAGFGIVAFMWVLPSSHYSYQKAKTRDGHWIYFCGLAFTMVSIPLAAVTNQTTGSMLSWVAFAGVLSLLGLVLANVTATLRACLKTPFMS